MERRTLLAIVLIAAIVFLYPLLLRWLGVDRYYRRPAPVAPARDTVAVVAAPESAARAPVVPPPAGPEAAAPAAELRSGFVARERAVARSYVLETDLYRAEFDARGARLTRVELKRYRSAHGASGGQARGRGGQVAPEDRVVLAGGPTLALDLGSGADLRPLGEVVYAVRESADAAGQVRALSFVAEDTAGTRVRQTYRARSGTYALDLEVSIEGVPLGWRLSDYSLTMRSWPLLTERTQVEDERALQATTLVGRDLRRDNASGMRDRTKSHAGNVVWAGVQSRYFTTAVGIVQGVGKEAAASGAQRALSPEERALLGPDTPPQQLVAESRLVMGLPSSSSPTNRFVVYCGPKDYFLLQRLGLQLERGVDLGWSWVVPFSKLLLQLLVWLHKVVPNYGVAILLLATLVRVLLHPLNMTSIKSMRAMQRLQPEVERLRARYKDNAQALNTALMALYRENKVNPAGGCLPMLVQIPIFFALYSVLYHAIELRQAPFVGWIDDLSAPDLLARVGGFPIRLLPLVMAGSGLLQQRLTPTDPRQVGTMYFMNIFMVIFFYNLPSGLVFYWTVMNVLTAVQQWLALREDGVTAPVSVETAAVARKRGGR
jgi:YidC/Oxa1 family membrane protein insertase